MRPVRLVFDTNVYVAAAFKQGSYADQWLEAAGTDRRFNVYVSEPILAEIAAKLEDKVGYSRVAVASFLARVRTLAIVVEPTRQIDVIRHDPPDNRILECAVEAQADLIVSADPDLYRQLKEFEGIRIIHPSNLRYVFPDGSEAA
jgi:putative PIN family toxin of toxin-antitoxin system